MFQYAENIVVKLTKGCNLHCKYCYVAHKDQYAGKFMSWETWTRLIDTINSDKLFHNLDEEKRKFTITFHGGEPTLFNKKLFREFCEYANKILSLEHSFSIQTNLTNVDDEWCEIFKTFKISVGLSWDGVSDANTNRNNNNFDFYKSKMDMLKKYDLDYGILIIVNKQSIDHIAETLSLLKSLGVKLVKANYVEDVYTDFGQESEIEVSGVDIFNKVVKYQLDNYIDNLMDSNLIELLNKFINNCFLKVNTHTGICGDAFCGAGKNVIEVDPDGTYSFCGRYSDTYSDIQLDTGYDFCGLKQTKKIINFAKEKHNIMLKHGCDLCYAKDMCSFGCMAFYYSKSQNNGKSDFGIRTDLVCDMHRSIFKYFMNNLDKILDAYIKYCFNHGSSIIKVFVKDMTLGNYQIFKNYLIENNIRFNDNGDGVFTIDRERLKR